MKVAREYFYMRMLIITSLSLTLSLINTSTSFSQTQTNIRISLFDMQYKNNINHFDTIILTSDKDSFIYTRFKQSEDKSKFIIENINFGKYKITIKVLENKVYSGSIIINEKNQFFQFPLDHEEIPYPEYPGGQDDLWCFVGKNFDMSVFKCCKYTHKFEFCVRIDINGTAYPILGNKGVEGDFILMKNEWERVVNLMPKWKPSVVKGKPIENSICWGGLWEPSPNCR